jgi:peptidoglycan/LPS O-acetylase OafA/YrhL
MQEHVFLLDHEGCWMVPLTHAGFLAMRRFPALDGMRAIAALMVVFGHYGGSKWTWLAGWIGVHMFFVISGFLITTLALREESRNGRLSLRGFYIRRVFRIMPVYYVVLGATVLLYWLRGEYHTVAIPEVLPYYLTFNNEYIAAGHVFGQSWTLAIEQKFYLVWPLLAFAAGAMTLARRLTVIAGALLVLVMAMTVPFYTSGVSSYIVILIGCTLAVLLHHPRGFALLRQLTRPVSGIVFAVVLVAIQANAVQATTRLGTEIPIILVYGVCVALLLLGLLSPGPLHWLLSRRLMSFSGERSYSLYLLQGFVALVIAATFPTLRIERTATAVAVALVSLILADVLYRWVELPMIEVGRRLVKRTSSHTGPAGRLGADDPRNPASRQRRGTRGSSETQLRKVPETRASPTAVGHLDAQPGTVSDSDPEAANPESSGHQLLASAQQPCLLPHQTSPAVLAEVDPVSEQFLGKDVAVVPGEDAQPEFVVLQAHTARIESTDLQRK